MINSSTMTGRTTMPVAWIARCLLAVATVALVTTGVSAASVSATSRTISTGYLVHYLPAAREHAVGYDRDVFRVWVDADHDGCDTRDEVLIKEADDEAAGRQPAAP